MPHISSMRKCDDGSCHKMSAREIKQVGEKILKTLERRGISCDITTGRGATKRHLSIGNRIPVGDISGSRINLSNCRLTEKYVKKYGRNVKTNTYGLGERAKTHKRRGRVLGWEDWVEFNDAVNDVLDELNISANVKSLGGKFNIREKRQRKTRADWRPLASENVGSMMYPQTRRDAWSPEKGGREEWRFRTRKIVRK